MSLEATVPAGFTATSLYWRADVIDPNVGELELWEQVTTDGMPAGGWTGGSTVTFGAPGLRESAGHRFRVAFCNANGCTCWSGPSAQYSTVSFPGTAPIPPSAIAQEVEDNFHRRPTTVKDSGGDGLGPNGVWLELNPVALSSIASDGETARILADGTGIYLARQATHEHSFAEVLLGKDDQTQTGFNFEVTGRIHMISGPAFQFYMVKLVQGWRGCDGQPALIVGRWGGDPNEGPTVFGCTNNVPTVEGTGIVIPTPTPNDGCDELPPIGTGGQVWLRIEMQDSIGTGDPMVTGTVAWGCTTGGIENCAQRCSFTRLDGGDPGEMGDIMGQWGFTGHDVRHRIDAFRAGSRTSP